MHVTLLALSMSSEARESERESDLPRTRSLAVLEAFLCRLRNAGVERLVANDGTAGKLGP